MPHVRVTPLLGDCPLDDLEPSERLLVALTVAIGVLAEKHGDRRLTDEVKDAFAHWCREREEDIIQRG